MQTITNFIKGYTLMPLLMMAYFMCFVMIYLGTLTFKENKVDVASNNLQNITKVLQNFNVKELKDSKDLNKLESELAHSKLEIQSLESKIIQAKSENK